MGAAAVREVCIGPRWWIVAVGRVVLSVRYWTKLVGYGVWSWIVVELDSW